MKPSDQDSLLNEILADDELSAFRQASLERGLTAIRRLRSQRSILRRCALAALPLLGALAFFLHWKVQNSGRRMIVSKPAREVVPSPSREIARVRFISDEELFALFPDRSLALIGKPGEQQLVFLDQN